MPENIYEYPDHLAPQLVPSTAWGSNLRAILSKSKWQNVRLKAIEKYGHKCYFCAAKPKSLDCHEIWQYILNDDGEFQRLIGVKPLCKNCHAVCHIGFWSSKGIDVFLRYKKHFAKVRKITDLKATEEINAAFKLHDIMSNIHWQLDIDLENITI